MVKREGILIVGMHRSGTSAIAGTLSKLGIDFGKKIMPSTPENPSGFFENMFFYRTNEDILRHLKSSWDDLNELPLDWEKRKTLIKYKNQIKDIIRTEFKDLELFGIKDPRLSLLLPIYEEAFKDLEITPKYIIIERKDIEIAKSLKKRDGFSPKHSLLLIRKYKDNIKKYMAKRKHITIKFDDLISDQNRIIRELGEYLSLKNIRSTMKKNVKDFLTPELKHHTLSEFEYIKELAEQIEEKDKEIENKDKQIKDKDKEIENKDKQIKDKDNEIENKDKQIKDKDKKIENKENHRLVLENTIQVYANSTSWKMTAPFRNIHSTLFGTTRKATKESTQIDSCKSGVIKIDKKPIKKENKVLIIGIAKTGTTALFYSIKNSMPANTKCFFEPKKEINYSSIKKPVLVKCLFDLKFDPKIIAQFDKVILIIRDPRDCMISTLLYSGSFRFNNYYTEKNKKEIIKSIEMLRKKEDNPYKISLISLLKQIFNQSEKETLTRMKKKLTTLIPKNIEKQSFIIKYEDFVENKIEKLEKYLKLKLDKDVPVDNIFKRVVRTKGKSSWRNWFTEEDVKKFKPLFKEFMLHYGYDFGDWELNKSPKINPEHCSKYFLRILNEKRLKKKLKPIKT